MNVAKHFAKPIFIFALVLMLIVALVGILTSQVLTAQAQDASSSQQTSFVNYANFTSASTTQSSCSQLETTAVTGGSFKQTDTTAVTGKVEQTGAREVKILFTHDIHSYLEPTKGYVEGEIREHGGAARLATLIKENSDENTIYLDAGDFSMGTLFQAGYSTDAYELRVLGKLGCAVTTLGNHEWDYGGTGLAQMLQSAMNSGDPLPKILEANINFDGELTEEQQQVKDAFEKYGVGDYAITEVNGVKLGIFGIAGPSSIEDSPTSGMNWDDYIETAKLVVDQLQDKCDVIICLSHSGTNGDGKTGDDFDLIDAVPGIDVVVSAHSHSVYHDAIVEDGTILGSAYEYLKYLGSMTLSVEEDGTVSLENYELLPIDESVEEDDEMASFLDECKENIEQTYLADSPTKFDEVIAHLDYNFTSLDEMYATHQEYPIGDLIADSYIYAAKEAGIDDIDVALVGLGTIRGSLFEGDITTADAFEICSLGVGADGSAGHPLACAYITGKELKLLVELDASLGEMVSSIKMSYSGLKYTFNPNRAVLDRVTDVYLEKDGQRVEIVDDQMYKVCANMYAVNMLGMLNGLTKGILSISPKYEDGTMVEDFYTCSLTDSDGNEVKEWEAFRDYLMSFDKQDGVSTIPTTYAQTQGRKVVVDEGGLAVIAYPGPTTAIFMALGAVAIAAVAFISKRIFRVINKRKHA
jgi:5'-nucleotidase / UDP-sugar diphosphatase